MPLARIRSQAQSIPEELEKRLRAAGYEIEVLRLEDPAETFADLELTLQNLPLPNALDAGKRLSHDASVYVAPGLSWSAASEAPTPKPSAPPQDIRAARLEAERQRVEAEEQKKQRVLEMWREAEAREQQRLAESKAKDERAMRLRAEQERAAKLQAEQVRGETERREQERAKQRHRENELREQERATALQRESELREQERLKEIRLEQARIQRLHEDEQRRWEAEQARLRAELRQKEEKLREQEQKLRAENERINRERELARQELQTARQEASRAAASNSPSGIQQVEPMPTSQRQARRPEIITQLAVVGADSRARLRQFGTRVLEGGARRMHHRVYRRAAIAASALTLVIMGLWMALAARGPADPLSTPDLVRSTTVEQQSPFGAAKIAAPVQPNQQPASVATPSTQATKPAKSNAAKNAARSARKQSSNNQEEEVVVRRFGTRETTRTPKKETATREGVKVFSDMD